MTDIYVYGSIGDSWYDDAAMTAHRFAYLMQQAGGEDVTVHVNSGGGDVFDANAMAEVIRSYKGRVTASIEGLAASAASYFALTADEVVMNPSALLMIHNPWGRCQGGSEDMRSTADMLDKVRGTIVGQYVRKTGDTEEHIRELMDAETWFDASEALEAGFVDSLTDAAPIAACVSEGAIDQYKRRPDGLVAGSVEPPSDAAGGRAGDAGATIDQTAEGEPVVGATEGETGAVSFVECVNGQFIRHKEN